jgi:magnesium transporter
MADFVIEDVLDELQALTRERNAGGLSNILADLHPVDIAAVLNRFQHDDREYIFSILPGETASEVLAHLDEVKQERLLKNEEPERIVEILENLDSDDAADIVGELPDNVRRKVLAGASEELAEDLRELLVYDEDTAGGLMALELIKLKADQAVIEAIQEIRSERDKVDDIYVIYVVDAFNKLVGYVTLTNLVLANPDDILADIMRADIVAVQTDTDQEEVAAIAKKYDLVSVPVVDRNYHLVGRITIDDIIDVLEDEASEDFNRMAGLTEDSSHEESVWRSTFTRLPWLTVGLSGGILAAFILSYFEASLAHVVALSFFIPVIMAMGGNSGIQSSSIVVRGLATGDINLRDAGRRVIRESASALVNGLINGILLGLLVTFWLDSPELGLAIGLTLNLIIIQAGIFGTIIPFTLKRLSIDPAIATGPFITTINDILGLLLYLTIVSLAI